MPGELLGKKMQTHAPGGVHAEPFAHFFDAESRDVVSLAPFGKRPRGFRSKMMVSGGHGGASGSRGGKWQAAVCSGGGRWRAVAKRE